MRNSGLAVFKVKEMNRGGVSNNILIIEIYNSRNMLMMKKHKKEVKKEVSK
jgi:hypothetical protein